MGFFSNFRTASAARLAIDAGDIEYDTFLMTRTGVEPFVYMMSAWNTIFTKQNKPMLALTAIGHVKPFGCIVSPLCVNLMHHYACTFLIDGFTETKMFAEFQSRMRAIWDHIERHNVLRLNELFEIHNPQSYRNLLRETGSEPFSKEQMIRVEQTLTEILNPNE